jgi:hypothetical protein
LQASPLGRFFAPSDSPKSGSARKGPKNLKEDAVVISDLELNELDCLELDYLELDED